MTGAALNGWEAIRDEVMRRIRVREWGPGATIPGEAALAVEFGCARATVNRALRDLAGAGVLERRRKAGTRVMLHPVRRATLEIAVMRQEVEARGQRYGYALLGDRVERVPPAVEAALGLLPGRTWRHLVSVHFADSIPFVREDRWLNPAILGDAAPDFGTISANEWLVANVPYAAGTIAFSAVGAGAEEALALDVADGTALFIVERTTWTAEAAITSVRLAYGPGYRLQTTV